MTKYYYLTDRGQQIGPVDISGIINARIKPSTQIWYPGLSSWVLASTLPELQPYLNTPKPDTKPQNWIWLGIVALLCCLPIGIVSIVYASKVDPAWNRGDYQISKEYSNNAQMWGFLSIGAGFLVFIFFFIIGLTLLE